VVDRSLEIEKAPHRSDDSLRDFLVCAQGETKEWNEKGAKRSSTHTNHTNKKMVVDLSVGKSQCKTRKGKKEKVDIDEKEKKDYMKDTQIPNTVERSRVKKKFFNIGIAVLQPRILAFASVYSPHTGPYPYSIHFLCHRQYHPYKANSSYSHSIQLIDCLVVMV